MNNLQCLLLLYTLVGFAIACARAAYAMEHHTYGHCNDPMDHLLKGVGWGPLLVIQILRIFIRGWRRISRAATGLLGMDP
jgi:hypothetical protein